MPLNDRLSYPIDEVDRAIVASDMMLATLDVFNLSPDFALSACMDVIGHIFVLSDPDLSDAELASQMAEAIVASMRASRDAAGNA